MWWRRLFTSRESGQHIEEDNRVWRLQALFNNFRRILFLNNAVLEDMARMEQTLGGEYVFDRAFLENSVRTLSSRVHHVTYNLNALTGNRHIALYDTYQDIRTILDDILAGNIGALAGSPVLPLSEVGWELEPLVGIHLVCLAELRHHPGGMVVDGFIITDLAVQILTREKVATGKPGAANSKNEILLAIGRQLQRLLDSRDTGRISVVISCLQGEEEKISEEVVYTLIAEERGEEVTIVGQDVVDDGPSYRHLADSQRISALFHDNDEHLIPYILALYSLIRRCLAKTADSQENGSRMVLFVRELAEINLTGTVQSRATLCSAGEGLCISAHMATGANTTDTFLLRRTYPFDLLQSKITPHEAGYKFPDGRLATNDAPSGNGFLRGSALINSASMKKLAETAMSLERMLGAPVQVSWERRRDNRYYITGLSAMPTSLQDISEPELQEEQNTAQVLSRLGQMVQSGVAAGRIVHVTGEMQAKDFPAGAVAVAKAAAPQLTPVLQRAAAIITEYGTTTGHLATVARELRLPAIFGVPEALSLLPAGTTVTVDASTTTVYRGILELLLRHGAREMELSPADPEYRILRRLLRFIMPLNLIDPDSPNFSAAGCRSYHDIIHFCHEKAVEELAHFQERRPGLGSMRTRRMHLGVPMDIRVLDIGGGMAPDLAAEPVPKDVLSAPLAIFLKGLLHPKAWATELPSLGLRDIISSMPRSMGVLANPVESLGENLAIVSHDYMNLSLRLGYHFSVIDAHLGVDDTRDYVYFRFAGGLADLERRRRRAKFIQQILETMEFKVSVKGDLVIGRLKLVEPRALRASLWILGALTAFSRQQDTGLYNDEDVKALYTLFADSFLNDYCLPTSAPEDMATNEDHLTGTDDDIVPIAFAPLPDETTR